MRRARSKGLFAALIGVLLAGSSGLAIAASGARERVRIDTGELRGAARDGVVSFKGIPFAAPPVGELRWRPPQPATPWTGIRDATRFGADCMQVPFPADAAPLRTQPAEDCLFVNVWVPEKASSSRLPVMVWIYGGGFVNGGTSPAVYDGSEFARRGIAFVSFNYRLGRFGFFAHPALSEEQRGAPLGNYGLLDQIAALRWVQRNIAVFGADAANVTIFGESAGGASVNILLTTPLASGLFHKAIVQSGGGRPGLFGTRHISGDAQSGEALGVAFTKKLGIEGQGAEALARLRNVPAEDIAAGLNLAKMDGDGTYVGGPMLDGQVVLGAPSQLFAAGKGAKVPLMIGATNMDIGFVSGDTIDELFEPFGAEAGKARALYNPSNSTNVGEVAFRIGGDQVMVEPARHIARILSSHGQPVYEYRFSYVAESLRTSWPGAMHASEIPFVFNTVAARYEKDLTAADAAAALAAHNYWVAFAKTGRPHVKGQPEWPAFDSASDVIMDFTNEGPKAGRDAWKARLDLAEKVNDHRERATSVSR